MFGCLLAKKWPALASLSRESPDGCGPIKSAAKSCQSPSGNDVDRIGSGGFLRATSWHQWQARPMTLNSRATVIYCLHFSKRPVTIAFPSFSAFHRQQRPLLSHGWRGVLLVLRLQQQKSYISFCTLMVVVRLTLPMIQLTWPPLSKAHSQWNPAYLAF